MRVYLDNAATTKMSSTAMEAMLPYMDTVYGNPSSLHSAGQAAAEALITARRRIADCIGASPKEITFTSGGSEADNQAILSAARAGEKKGRKHIISTAFEHHAVLHTLQKLEKEGFEITLLDVHENGIVLPQQVADAVRDDTCLVSVMYANNEIGTIQPIEAIGKICREKVFCSIRMRYRRRDICLLMWRSRTLICCLFLRINFTARKESEFFMQEQGFHWHL